MHRLLGSVFLALLLWLGTASPLAAHEVRPALLQITETAPGRFEVVWKQPALGDLAIRLRPHLSGGAIDVPPGQQTTAPGFLIRSWRVEGGPPLDGQTVTIEGLRDSVIDVVVRVTAVDGRTLNAVIRPASPTLTLSLSGPAGTSVPAYLALGVEHILTGIDHLLFVLGLLLLIGPGWRILKAVTAFTVAHSITLALAAVGFVRFPSAVIEALVALSIVFVATELLPRPGRAPTLTQRHPWLIALLFGLLHGLAFAGALAEIGLPARAAPMALLLFNLGVELGQLAFIAVALAAMAALSWLAMRLPWDIRGLARAAPAYGIGGMAAYWLIERTAAAFA